MTISPINLRHYRAVVSYEHDQDRTVQRTICPLALESPQQCECDPAQAPEKEITVALNKYECKEAANNKISYQICEHCSFNDF